MTLCDSLIAPQAKLLRSMKHEAVLVRDAKSAPDILSHCAVRARNSGVHLPGHWFSHWIWVDYNDLTATSLGIMVSKGNHFQMTSIQVSEISEML